MIRFVLEVVGPVGVGIVEVGLLVDEEGRDQLPGDPVGGLLVQLEHVRGVTGPEGVLHKGVVVAAVPAGRGVELGQGDAADVVVERLDAAVEEQPVGVVPVDVADLADGPGVVVGQVGGAHVEGLDRGDGGLHAHVQAAQLDVGRVVHAEALARGVGARRRPRLVHGQIAALVKVGPLPVEAALEAGAHLHLVRDAALDVEHQLRGEAIVARVVVALGVRRAQAHRSLGLVILIEDLGICLRPPAQGKCWRRGPGADLLHHPLFEVLAPLLEKRLLLRGKRRVVQADARDLVVIVVLFLFLFLFLFFLLLGLRSGGIRGLVGLDGLVGGWPSRILLWWRRRGRWRVAAGLGQQTGGVEDKCGQEGSYEHEPRHDLAMLLKRDGCVWTDHDGYCVRARSWPR